MTTDVTWNRLRALVKSRDKSFCYHCGEFSDSGHCDHLIPLSKGGTDAIENLVWSCARCNLSKGNKVPLPPAQKQQPQVEELSFSRILPGLRYSLTAYFIPPYPDYHTFVFPNWEAYYHHIISLTSRSIIDWIRRRIWITPRAANNVLIAHDATTSYAAKLCRYYNITDKDLSESIQLFHGDMVRWSAFQSGLIPNYEGEPRIELDKIK